MNRQKTQRWSEAIESHLAKPDGIIYRSRLDPDQRSVAAFDRADGSLSVAKVRSLDSEAMSTTLNETLNHYWFGLID
jgi:hypothetical protein